MVLGILLLIASVSLLTYNRWDDGGQARVTVRCIRTEE